MRLRGIFALFTLVVMAKGAWWVAAVQPVILSIGAFLTAIDLDVLDLQLNRLKLEKTHEDNKPQETS